MSGRLTEQQVLEKLGIEDFRHITKDKVILMTTMLDKMDSDVAKKALEQFPYFSSTMKEILCEYQDSLDKGLISNEESVKSCYSSCDIYISECQKMLEREELSFDERIEILERVRDIILFKGDKDSENKKFIIKLSVIGLAALGFTATTLLAAVGGKTNINLDGFKRISG